MFVQTTWYNTWVSYIHNSDYRSYSCTATYANIFVPRQLAQHCTKVCNLSSAGFEIGCMSVPTRLPNAQSYDTHCGKMCAGTCTTVGSMLLDHMLSSNWTVLRYIQKSSNTEQ